MAELADVNVLLALSDPAHVFHDRAQHWFVGAHLSGWATCPLTENGAVRIQSGPTYQHGPVSLREALARLQALKLVYAATHTFWPHDVSLTDSSLFDVRQLSGHKQWTDLYLLGLCHRHGGTFVTFDGGIMQTARAIVKPAPSLYRALI